MFTATRSTRAFSSTARRLAATQPSFIRRAGKNVFRLALAGTVAGTGYVCYNLYRERFPADQKPQSATFENGSPRKNLVILGTGWGSISLLKNLDTTLYNVTVVSPRNFFLFSPLLPSLPTSVLNVSSIIESVRTITRRLPGEVLYLEAEATDIDPAAKTIKVKSENIEKELSYDYLVVGVGAQPTTFGTPGVYENACFLKEIPDAQNIRTRVMNNIEKAATLSASDPERKRLLSFVVVGGGPTGVEFAAELKDYVDEDLQKWMPELAKEIKVTLVEAMPNILGMFDKSLIKYTEDVFATTEIDLKLKTMVKNVDATTVTAKCGDEILEIPYGVLVWATGNAPQNVSTKLMASLPEAQNSRRGLLINDKLQLLGAEDSIWALGDCTFYPGLFPTAQVAHQEGLYLATELRKQYKVDQLKHELLQGADVTATQSKMERLSAKPFVYKHQGALAYIGSEKAIADLAIGDSKYQLSGNMTFLFWKSAYLAMCLSFTNRVLIAADWMKTSFFGRDPSL